MAIVISHQRGRPSNRPSDAELMDLLKVKTTAQIAAMYGVGPSAVRTWVYRMRKADAAAGSGALLRE